ncbi:MAG: cytochrome c3 family protein [Candidatus Rokubacteria bacterium]|nr:cytochrome c3 family protein [Candidatus Rokubacteria bacterium]
MSRVFVALAVCAALLAPAAAGGAGIVDTVHNLSATGAGAVKAPGVGEVCIFCHTPHRAGQTVALWNRDLPARTYNLYGSSTLEATLNQPTGASRLCLSCHDGTTALGNLRVAPATGPATLGPLTGRASLGTDLSDDHPASFLFDTALALKQGQLVDPTGLPKAVPLDSTRQLQCTSCHDPHENRYRKFLRVDDRFAALCTACHRQRNWVGSAHATSVATWNGSGTNPWPSSPYTTVADNGCESCHRPHAAPRPPRLLSDPQEPAVCLVCHSGSVAATRLDPEFLKPSAHPITATSWTHEPHEDPAAMARHVACTDCHNPHQAITTPGSAPAVPGRLRGVRGLNLAGASVTEVQQEYEVCLKCHGVRDQTTPGVVRSDNTRNIRLKISPSNPSYHPVATNGKNDAVGGLEAGWSAGSLLYCTDCHNNDEWTPAGTRPRGSHGSRYTPILEREYQVNDPSSESYQAYAMCYKCHNRSVLIEDRARTFLHKKHVVDTQASCAVCHDAHGSRQSIRLINFMLRDRTGKTVVSPSQGQKRLEYISTGPGRGTCYLLCHGKNHEPKTYPD